MPISNQYGTTTSAGATGPAGHPEQDDSTRPGTVSPSALTQVFAHLRSRARSHSGSPATGLYWMSSDQWRACISELCRRGHQITASIVTRGDRAANEIGYTLTAEPPPARRRHSVGVAAPARPSALSIQSTVRSPGVAL